MYRVEHADFGGDSCVGPTPDNCEFHYVREACCIHRETWIDVVRTSRVCIPCVPRQINLLAAFPDSRSYPFELDIVLGTFKSLSLLI